MQPSFPPPTTPPALTSGELEHRSIATHTFWGALAGGTILATGGHLLNRASHNGPMRQNLLIGLGVAGGILGAWQGNELAKDHNEWANALSSYRHLDAQNRLLPEYLPAVDVNYYRKQDSTTEGLIAAARGALIWGAASLAVELMAYGPKFSWQKLDKGLVFGDAMLWGGIDGSRIAARTDRANHRADVVGYYTEKARAHAAAIPPLAQGFAARMEHAETSPFAGR